MRAHRFFMLCLLGILLWETGHAQKNEKPKAAEKTDEIKETDSKKSYKSFKISSSRQSIAALLKEANALKEKSPTDALTKVQEALGLSLAQGDGLNEGRCYILLGEINEGIQEWKLALENYGRAYEKFSYQKAVPAEYPRVLQGMGNANLKLGLYPDALKYFQEALAQTTNTYQRTALQLNISEVYYQMGQYDKALTPLKDINTPKKIADASTSNQIQNQEAKIYAQLNQFDKSKELYDNSVNTLRQSKSVTPKENESLTETKDEIAGVLRSQNRYDEEIDLRNKSIVYNLESKNLDEVTKDKVEIGKTLDAKGQPRAALREIQEAANMADTLNNPRQQVYAYQTLATLYEKNGMNMEALDAYHKFSFYVNKADTLSNLQLAKRADLIRIQKDIEELTKNVSIGKQQESLEQATVFRQQLIIYGLSFLLLVIGAASVFSYKKAQASKVANQLLALKSLRSQMNPHFIFNALNSVNHFIAQQDERAANKFLSEFSQLMRLVLENSQEDFIPLQQELDILSLYVKLEHYRFRDKFDYTITVDENLNTDAIQVPPMLIQPYIENAVWHGLRYKHEKGHLLLTFRKEENMLVVEITDDGIGRKQSAELKTTHQKKHQSMGLKNIRERLDILNNVYRTHYRITLNDPAEGTGTEVRIYVPLTPATQGV
ncbi:tetratricopeptide repeat-containing sensor histidine kinase [Chryseolinea lacunae]|uniref:Histidine kinase n=1 Tax=Chryseolinea lacunae TaxID=2801331 RepID=A0ABS1KZU4_9BACT|nr:histidine kinase [Chryseolinea lacunae]MBL0743841.1 histidine kinase [Chryseolinea lacunae]